MATANNRNGVHGEDGAGFEQSFKRLQEVVQRLSDGNLTLQDALASFEEGMKLADRCADMLDAAELRLRNVSAGTARAASEAVGELEEVMRRAPRGSGDDMDEIVLEVESYETTLTFDTPPEKAPKPTPGANLAYSPLPNERRGGAPKKPEPPSKPADLELDPLFDEDD